MGRIKKDPIKEQFREYGRKGGNKVAKKYGSDHFRELARMSHAKRALNKRNAK